MKFIVVEVSSRSFYVAVLTDSDLSPFQVHTYRTVNGKGRRFFPTFGEAYAHALELQRQQNA
jgi:hypothetical protein